MSTATLGQPLPTADPAGVVPHRVGRGGRRILLLVVIALALVFAAQQLPALDGVLGSLVDLPWWTVPLALAVSSSIVLGATASLLGATTLPLRTARTAAATLAASALGRLAPASLGSLGTVGLYLRRQGATAAEVGTALAVDAAAGVVVHVALLLGVSVVLGDAALGGGSGWSAWVVAAVVLVVALAAVATAVVRRSEHRAAVWLRATGAEAVTAARVVLTDPRRALLLVGGSLLVTGGHVATLWVVLAATAEPVPLLTVAFVSLGATAVAAAAPTPGGLGAVEAALVGGLGLAGVAAAPAVTGVLVYRLVTFWLPILPGAVATGVLRARRHL